MPDFIPVNQPLLNGNEKKYLNECIDTGWISSEGPFINKFEENFALRVNRKYAIAVSNGTAAIDAAITAIDIGPDDEIIMPTFTIISCILQIVRLGAKPVFVDSQKDTWNMDVAQIEKRITSKTKAIMVVHTYGLPVEMDEIMRIAEKHKLKIIEDAAEMHGQSFRNKPCGSFGDISIFSFYPNKHITTGEGGMIVTNDYNLAEKCRSLRNLCFSSQRRFVHNMLGWNLRMTNMQAALGLAQLERLDEIVRIKRKMGKLYTNLLSGLDTYLQLPLEKTDYADNIYWIYGIVLKDSVPFDAIEAMKRLAVEGIGTRPFFYPMHLQPVFLNKGLFMNEKYPVAENLSERGFYIPSGLALTENQIEIVVEKVKKIFR